MNTATLYRDLTVQGVTLYLDGGALRYRAPKGKMTPDVLANIKTHKVELVSLLATNDHCKKYINNIESIVRESNRESDNISTWSMDRYAHLVTCNQCEYLSLTGSCSRLGKRVIATALRECDSFTLLKKERPPLEEVKPYTQDELNRLLNQAARPLYHHLIDCEQCSLEDARYCVDGFVLGNSFDDLLLCFDDATNKRYELMNQVIKARVSGRRAFESLFSDNAPLPRQDAPITRKWGNTKEYEAFINHWTGCKFCKPNLNRYCDEGQRLEKEANC